MSYIGVGTFKTSDRMRELVTEVLDSGRISYGPMSRAFEQRFAAIHECQFSVLSNSGTDSLRTAIAAMREYYGWQVGDEIILPATTFVATLNVVLQNRLTPVLVDVDPKYYELDVNLLPRAITRRTRAILPVHLFGQPCNMSVIRSIATSYTLSVIEDSCECMFVGHAGKKVGSWGDIGCFSTYVAHLLTTGVGGLATTNNHELAALMRSYVNHGRDGIYINIDDGRTATGTKLLEIATKRFKFERIGYSSRITELEAALGLAQLDTWQSMIMARQQNAATLTNGLRALEPWLQLPEVRPDTDHAWMMFPVVCRNESKWDLVAHLEERGIETREMLPLTNQPVYHDWIIEEQYPVSRWINEGGFYIACHQDLTQAELDQIIDGFETFFAGRPRHTIFTGIRMPQHVRRGHS